MNPDPPSPPSAARVPRVSIVHGTELVDPYAWLRDPDYPEVSDSAILDHLNAENAYVESLLRPHEALVESLLKELRGRIQEADESVAVRDGDYFYQWRFSEGDEYRVHYRRHVRKEDWEVLLDERILADGHDYFRLGGMDVSDDSLLAFSTDTSGDERYRMRFRNLHDGSDLHESIPNTIDEPIWLPGTREILYVELSDEWRPYRVRLHAIGTSVEDDPILYEEADEGFFVSADLSQDRRWIIITAGDHETTEVHVLPASVPRSQARLISPRRRGHQYHVDHAGTRFYILTNDTAVNFRLVSAPEDDPGEDKWAELIPGRTDVYLHGFTPFAEFMLIEERANAVDRIVIRTYGGESHEIVFPESICAAHEGENPEFDVQTVQIRYESMITPPTVYDYHVPSRELTARKTVRIPSGYDRDRYRTERLLVPARDGSTVPVSIVYRADFPRDGSRYVHLYGYGAYGYGQVPGFSRNQLSLLDRGFAFAIAHVRGGDELGYGWYLDGKLMKRWNTFTDFVDTARHLVDAGYTSAGRICISGGSAGGELIGVVLNEAPELWAAAVAHVPFVDVTNTMLDASLPLTPMEWPEWGNPVDDRPAFEYISSYSPYDNVREQEYPPLFVTAGLNDPRVTYWEPAKWVARLRYRKTDDNVLLLKTNMGAGHAGKSGRFQHLREAAEELAFLLLATSTKP
jgi:oligopeptidase B